MTIENKRDITKQAMARINDIKARAREQAKKDVDSGDKIYYFPYDQTGEEYIYRATYNDTLYDLEEAGILEVYSEDGKNYLREK